jgi:hypothetical protein
MRRTAVVRHYRLACWALLGLVARVFVPAGFMVGATDGDWPIVACPGQNLGVLQPTHRDTEHEPQRGDTEAPCLSGHFFALTGEVDASDSAPATLPESARTQSTDSGLRDAGLVGSVHPRGPPSTRSVAV